jgi:hypothetical protein
VRWPAGLLPGWRALIGCGFAEARAVPVLSVTPQVICPELSGQRICG